jgi:hypothetical protein
MENVEPTVENVEPTICWDKTNEELEDGIGFYGGTTVGLGMILHLFDELERGKISKKELVEIVTSEIADDEYHYKHHRIELIRRKNEGEFTGRIPSRMFEPDYRFWTLKKEI